MIFLTKKIFEQIIEHCQKEYPGEACGILAGKIVRSPKSNVPCLINNNQQKVTKVYKMVNTSESPETCYFMKPEEQLEVFKEMRELNLEMLGIYHSHTGTSAYPSKRDCEMAFYPEVDYVIVSLKDFDNPDIRAFKITEGKIEEEKIQKINIVEKNQK